MEWVEITASTVEAAKERALEQLGVAEGDAEIQVVQEPKTGLFGRVRGEARVRARVQPTSPRPKRSRGGKGRGDGQRGAKPRGEGQGGQKTSKPKGDKQQGGRQDGSRNGDRKAAGAAGASSVAPAGGASKKKEEDEMADGVTLEEQAELVISSGEERTLEPMSPADRKVVHDAINEVDGVTTRSEGEDARRHVVIAPAG